MDQKTVPRVGILGCGRIGSLWDEETQHPYAKTHAKAFHKLHPESLYAFCDLDLDRAKEAAQFWSCSRAFNHVDQFLQEPLDIICICTPIETRSEILEKIQKHKPQAILIIEKPFAETTNEAQKFLKILSFPEKVFLNYSRRFAPGLQNLQNEIEENKYGRFQSGTAYYGNGLLNNGSHMINLIEFLLDRIESAKALAITDDQRPVDPTLSFQLQCKGSQIVAHGLNHNFFTVFELDLLFEKSRVRLSERAEKIEIFSVQDDPIYKGFKVLGNPEIRKAHLELSLENLALQAWNLYLGKSSIRSCTPQDSLYSIKIIESIRSSHVS